jgi:hypothetical protein
MLSPTQQQTLRHLMDRIVPPDEDPGAWDSGVGDYLDRQLHGDLRDQLFNYQLGLDALEAEALASANASFAALPADQQDALLRRVEAGQVKHLWPIDPARFFGAVVGHVIEGYYSDPGNGGNRDGAAWHMIGYVFPQTP